MTIEETIDLLTVAASFDQRTVGETDAVAWHAAIGDLPFTDARAAVIGHYRESRDRIMPADVFKRVKAMRADRIAREVIPHPGHELADQPGRYRVALRGFIGRIADGFSGWKALPAASRPEPPAELIAQARAGLRPQPSKQEIARIQAEEFRKERKGLPMVTPYDDEPGRALPRYTVLPGDPPELRLWLIARAKERGEGLPEGWPQEEPR